MHSDLRVDFRLEYLPQQRGRAVTGNAGLKLSTEDPYYFVVTPSESCYLYLFQIHSTGEVLQVFPNRKYTKGESQVSPGKMRIPSGTEWFRVPPQPGEEQVVLVAAKWAIPELENLASSAAADKDPERRRQHVERLLSRAAIEDKYSPNLPGLVFGSDRFINAGAPDEAREEAGSTR
jgi:hypothetical protein